MEESSKEKFAVHYYGPEGTSYGLSKGQMVGGPYSSINRARNARDKKDNAYGGYVHRVVPYGEGHDMKKHGEGKEMGEHRLSLIHI